MHLQQLKFNGQTLNSFITAGVTMFLEVIPVINGYIGPQAVLKNFRVQILSRQYQSRLYWLV